MKQFTAVQALSLMDDIDSAESMPELEILISQAESDYNGITQDSDVSEAIMHSRTRLMPTMVVVEPTGQNAMMLKLLELQQQLASMQIASRPKVAVIRSTRSYKLLSFDVKWSTKPQVHAIAKILETNFNVGDVIDEAVIINAMESNKHILETRQTGKRIWDYYKGDHAEGLLMHGNVEKL